MFGTFEFYVRSASLTPALLVSRIQKNMGHVFKLWVSLCARDSGVPVCFLFTLRTDHKAPCAMTRARHTCMMNVSCTCDFAFMLTWSRVSV